MKKSVAFHLITTLSFASNEGKIYQHKVFKDSIARLLTGDNTNMTRYNCYCCVFIIFVVEIGIMICWKFQLVYMFNKSYKINFTMSLLSWRVLTFKIPLASHGCRPTKINQNYCTCKISLTIMYEQFCQAVTRPWLVRSL